ncbi:MAG: hypothetical protein Q8W45_09445 [Candidatus Palauibacterales bacterium]|nr:hypothetical protein [Candidatus Palauibacterales bacterium]MDP2483494.1 hypothetical protein [Candidatus Palauibacterales bacterium]
MSEVRGIVVAHGHLARCLAETTESISGILGAIQPISNADCSPEILVKRIREAVDGGRVIVFVDLDSGSCCHAARSVCRGVPEVPVVSGVNVPMLLDFVFHRDMEPVELARRLVSKGQSGVVAHLPGFSS